MNSNNNKNLNTSSFFSGGRGRAFDMRNDREKTRGRGGDGDGSGKDKIEALGRLLYEPVWNIIDERWDRQLHRPLHAAAYYLNPHFHYDPNFRDDDVEVKQGLYNCMARLVSDLNERSKIGMQLADFHYARGLFDLDTAVSSRKVMLPAEWWDFYGDGCPELKKFAIRVLSLTCSSSGCERNWSSFEMVHTKRRNRLHQKKMNDLVYVMYNLKLKSKQVKRNLVIPFDELHSDDEWITEDGDANNIGDGENIQPPHSDENEHVDDGGNAELEQGGGSTNQPLDDLEGLVFDDANIEEHLSSDEEDELEENEDDDGFDVGLDFD